MRHVELQEVIFYSLSGSMAPRLRTLLVDINHSYRQITSIDLYKTGVQLESTSFVVTQGYQNRSK
jgi:hypothetical protein